MNQSVPYLEFCGISKEFPGVKALRNVSFCCQQGTVHALMGENGAGKSTLLKILSGFQSPTTGVVKLAGQSGSFRARSMRWRAGSPSSIRSCTWCPR